MADVLFTLDPDATLWYYLALKDWLGDKTISTVSWSVPSELNKEAESVNTGEVTDSDGVTHPADTRAAIKLSTTSNAASGQTYVVTATVTDSNGEIEDWELGFYVGDVSLSGYCARRDIESIYGSENTQQWADLDKSGDPTSINDRVAEAIADATDYINDRFRDSQYTIPLQGPPRQIKRLCARLAGLYLYEARGAQDVNPETGELQHRFRWVKKKVDDQIDEYLSGRMGLDAEIDTDRSSPITLC